MKSISIELALIINLSNASKWHKKNCRDEHCNVTLLGLKQAAQYINEGRDYDEGLKIIEEMEII